MTIPVYGYLRGDTIVLVVLLDDRDRISDLAASVIEAAAIRVKRPARARVERAGTALEGTLTLAEAHIEPLDLVTVIPEEG